MLLSSVENSQVVKNAIGHVMNLADSDPASLAEALRAQHAALDHLVSEELGVNLIRGMRVTLFAVTQGAITAAGSRVAASLR